MLLGVVSRIIPGSFLVAILVFVPLVFGRALPRGEEMLYVSRRNSVNRIVRHDVTRGIAQAVGRSSEADQQRSPVWSPDGERIAFVANRDGAPEIFVMDAFGHGLQALTDHRADDFSPSWSPDGAHIVFQSNRDGGHDIYILDVMAVDDVRRLTNHRAGDGSPSWSPDGRWIAFSSNREDGIFAIYTMSADGGEARRITRATLSHTSPRWSPDGSQIVFVSREGGRDHVTIALVSAEGGGFHRLTWRTMWNEQPAWSPDGAPSAGRIAFVSNRSGLGLEIYVMKADGSDVRRVTYNQTLDWAPSWRP